MGLSFLKGLVAAVNPCAFVLLPTYLAYFLGSEAARGDDRRATIRRALVVSGAVSAGFLSVFLAIGLLSQYVTRWIEDHAKYATLAIGVAFVVIGVAMLAGRKLPISIPRWSPKRTDRTVASMALYGVAYAVASISCTLPLFSTTLFGNAGRNGWDSGVAHVLAYGAGMALIVTALTVTMAFANTSLLGALRRGSTHVDRIAGVLVTLSGLYLVYYFWLVEVNEGSSPVTERVTAMQDRIQLALNDHWRVIAAVLAAIVVGAAVYVARGGRRDGALE